MMMVMIDFSYSYPPNFQLNLLEPLAEAWRSKHEDTKEFVLGKLMCAEIMNVIVLLILIHNVCDGQTSDAIFQILQTCGQVLEEGWPIILNVLQSAATGNRLVLLVTIKWISFIFHTHTHHHDSHQWQAKHEEKSSSNSNAPAGNPNINETYVALAFKSIELIVSDFLECVPYGSFQLLIATIGWFCTQRAETNISFTSIGETQT